MDEIKLKPCPFCGGKAEYIINSNYVRCTTHGWQFGIKSPACSDRCADYQIAKAFHRAEAQWMREQVRRRQRGVNGRK